MKGRTNFALYLFFIVYCHNYILGFEDENENHEKAKYASDDLKKNHCHSKDGDKPPRRRFLLYEVNRGEGFNLRRDVFVRLAVFVEKLQAQTYPLIQDAARQCRRDHWVLVLPPWGPLYHWQSEGLAEQRGLPWRNFFDLPSINRFVEAIEFEDYVRERFGEVNDDNNNNNNNHENEPFVDRVLHLKHFPFDGNWEDRIEEEECEERDHRYTLEDGKWRGYFWGHHDHFHAKKLTCLSVMGHASSMTSTLSALDDDAVLLERAETLLHDSYGDARYWAARRSMVFAGELRAVGDGFRRSFLDSSDEADGTIMEADWRKMERKAGEAKGGPYLAVHLRRKDYIRARGDQVPSLESAARQVNAAARRVNVTRVFVATDAPDEEFRSFADLLRGVGDDGKGADPPLVALRFVPSAATLKKLGDGGVAIVDQWIAAHARHFVGTHESTFSFRIQEERQILGFHPDTIFNRLCGVKAECEPPSKWLIVY